VKSLKEPVKIRKIYDVRDLEKIVEIEKSAWGMPDYKETTPVHVLKAINENGGLIIGAYDKETMIGFSMGWIVGCGESQYFYSHMTGVLEDKKYKNIGYQLKLYQREEVLKMGIKVIKWTFDPLQGLNLNFNLEKLGAIARIYKENYYGNIRDSINEGLDTDRFEAEWYISSNYVLNKLRSALKTPSIEELTKKDINIALDRSIESNIEIPIRKNFDLKKIILIAIPREISKIKNFDKNIANLWRSYTREAYKFYLSNGYIAVGFAKNKEKYGYVVLLKTDLNSLLGGNTWI
jgi:predicted GNAT superfamily acetyltransferase